MPHDYGIWSLLPPILAIVLAIATRQVFLSLFAGIWVGHLVIAHWNPLGATVAALDACVAVFQDAGNTRVILFCALVGSLIALIQRSGGVDGFVNLVQDRRLVRGPRSAGLMAMAVGALVFIETSISSLVTGTVARPIFDRLRMSREKLAYVCDTSSAPVCVMIPLNAWGAYVLAQLAILEVDQPVALFVRAMPFNFYAIVSLLLLLLVLSTGRDFGPMKRAERRAREEGKLHADGAQPMVADDVVTMPPAPQSTPRAVNMMLPVCVMMAVVPVGIAWTGYRDLPAGAQATFWNVLGACSGSTSVFWAVTAGVIIAGVQYRLQSIMNVREIVEVALKGAASLVPLVVLIIMAFAIGRLCGNERLQTGAYIASKVSSELSPIIVAPLVFAVAGGIAFSTGTSWGTFAIMLPIALPLAAKAGVPPQIAVAAVLGGGVFGDHCSPISDTTIVSSMAAACDHIDHVRTQLPYAVVAGVIALLLYAIAGGLA